MDDIKKRVASIGAAATLAASAGAVVGSNLNASDEKVVPEKSYVQDIDDNKVEEVGSATDVFNSIFDSNSSVTSYDYPSEVTSESVSKNELNNEGGLTTDYNINTTGTTSNTITSDLASTTSGTTTSFASEDASVSFQNNADNKYNVDYDCYSLMQDAIGFSMKNFVSQYSSLSEAIESNYNVKLSDKQRARYDTVIQDTYDIYRKGIAAYESGDIETFRKICDEVLNSKKYLNLDDFVDIIAININLQGDYIKDSSNYTISDGKLIIDGYTVDGLFMNRGYNGQFVIDLVKLYDEVDEKDKKTLDIMQVPIYVVKEAMRPSNFTLVNDKTTYSFDRNELRRKLENISLYYCSKLNIKNFSIDYKEGKPYICGYDENYQKVDISDSIYVPEMKQYLQFFNQWIISSESKVGYFDGASMKEFLAQYENGNTNIKVSEVDNSIAFKDYDCYSLMKDTIAPLYTFNSKYSSLTEALEATYGVKLSDEQKARYDTIFVDTYDAYIKGVYLYEHGRVSEFRKLCDDILVNKKYLNFDDLVDILSININSQDDNKLIKDSSKYSYSSGRLIIDDVIIDRLLPSSKYLDNDDINTLIDCYNSSVDLNVLDIMQVPYFVSKEAALNPTCFSLAIRETDGITVFSYSKDKLNKKSEEIYNYFSSLYGLTDFGTEKSIDGNMSCYGYDENHTKIYISTEDSQLGALSRYLNMAYPRIQKSQDGTIGYFDGPMMRDYLKTYDQVYNYYSK